MYLVIFFIGGMIVGRVLCIVMVESPAVSTVDTRLLIVP